jgi:hypothetical protein
MSTKKNKGLGRGLRALIPTEPEGAEEGVEIVDLPLDKIKPGAFQARQQFDQEALEELSASIKAHGIMQPVVVRFINEAGRTSFFSLVFGICSTWNIPFVIFGFIFFFLFHSKSLTSCQNISPL